MSGNVNNWYEQGRGLVGLQKPFVTEAEYLYFLCTVLELNWYWQAERRSLWEAAGLMTIKEKEPGVSFRVGSNTDTIVQTRKDRKVFLVAYRHCRGT